MIICPKVAVLFAIKFKKAFAVQNEEVVFLGGVPVSEFFSGVDYGEADGLGFVLGGVDGGWFVDYFGD